MNPNSDAKRLLRGHVLAMRWRSTPRSTRRKLVRYLIATRAVRVA